MSTALPVGLAKQTKGHSTVNSEQLDDRSKRSDQVWRRNVGPKHTFLFSKLRILFSIKSCTFDWGSWTSRDDFSTLLELETEGMLINTSIPRSIDCGKKSSNGLATNEMITRNQFTNQTNRKTKVEKMGWLPLAETMRFQSRRKNRGNFRSLLVAWGQFALLIAFNLTKENFLESACGQRSGKRGEIFEEEVTQNA